MEEEVDDFKEAVFSSHSGVDAHGISEMVTTRARLSQAQARQNPSMGKTKWAQNLTHREEMICNQQLLGEEISFFVQWNNTRCINCTPSRLNT